MLYFFKKFFSFLKILFINGLVALLPITATILFVTFTYNLVIRWLTPLKGIEPDFLQQIPGSEFVIVASFILVVGFLLQILVIYPIIHYFERLIDKIPFIRTIYSASKTVVDFFNVQGKKEIEEKKVVLIEFPRKGSYALAFQLDTSKDTFQKLIPHNDDQEEYVKVFLPSSPAPTTGFFLLIPRSEVVMTDITFEEAIRTIVSCGLVTPESLKKLDL